MERRISTTTAAFVLGLILAGSGTSTAIAASTADTEGSVVTETLASGNLAHFFIPADDALGSRATATPILVVLSDSRISSDDAAALVRESGVAEIAAQEHGVVAVLTPAEDAWSPADTAVFPALLQRYADETGPAYDQAGTACLPDFLTGEPVCKYPGTRARVYLFADGAGADFVSRSVSAGVGVPAVLPDREGNPQSQLWTPSAVYLSNTETSPIAPFNEAELPAYLVNASASVEKAYTALNGVHGLVDTAASQVTEGLDRKSILKGYGAVLQRAISHWNATQTEIYEIADYAADGTTVTHDAPAINGAPLEYFAYEPEGIAEKDKHPLVLAFHGGGNNAEYLMYSTQWVDVAKKEGFMVVSVNQHVDRSPEDIVELLDHLEKKFPSIDASRVYATGFSMGSVKTWALSESYPERFAGVAPMSGSFEPEVAKSPGTPIPVIYFAGHESPLTEYPHTSCDSERCGDGEAGWLDARLAALFAQNGVDEDWEFDRSQDPDWGLAPESTSTIEDPLFNGVSVHVNSYASADGQIITQLASVRNVAHEATPIEAQIAWDFLSQYSRGVDGEIIVDASDSETSSGPPILAIILIAAAALAVAVIAVTVARRGRRRTPSGA